MTTTLLHAGPARRSHAGILLGLGLGGMLDGILLHQILQWHHVLSGWYPPDTIENLRLNTLADGLFHAVTYLLTLGGVIRLWQASRADEEPARHELIGQMLIGWGAFIVVEGAIAHLLLGLHHVNETVARAQWIWWDLGFLAAGALLLAIGAVLAHNDRRLPAVSNVPLT